MLAKWLSHPEEEREKDLASEEVQDNEEVDDTGPSNPRPVTSRVQAPAIESSKLSPADKPIPTNHEPEAVVPDLVPLGECSNGIECRFSHSLHYRLFTHPPTHERPKPRSSTSFFETKDISVVRQHSGVEILYHVTSAEAADSIRADGYKMKPGTRGMFGPGIYFAKTIEDCKRKAQAADKSAVIRALVYLGTCLEIRKPASDMKREDVWSVGCDSVFAPGGDRPQAAVSTSEWVVYDARQIISLWITVEDGASTETREFANNFARANAALQAPMFWWSMTAPNSMSASTEVVTPTNVMSWNQFQQNLGGQGYTRDEIRDAYYQHKENGRAPATRTNSVDGSQRSSNSWNEFQAANAGKGLTKEEMRSAYYEEQSKTSTKSRAKSPSRDSIAHSERSAAVDSTKSSTGKPAAKSVEMPSPAKSVSSTGSGNTWNDFQASMKGQGLSKSEMRDAYHATSSPAASPAKSTSSVATPSPAKSESSTSSSNSWNSFQASMGGQGLSKSEIREAYYSGASSSTGSGSGGRSSSSSSGGGGSGTSGSSGNSWNSFQASMGGKGYSRAQIQAAYNSSKR